MYNTELKCWSRCALCAVSVLVFGIFGWMGHRADCILVTLLMAILAIVAFMFLGAWGILALALRMPPEGTRYYWIWDEGTKFLLREFAELREGATLRSLDLEVLLDSKGMRFKEQEQDGRRLYCFEELECDDDSELRCFGYSESAHKDLPNASNAPFVRRRRLLLENNSSGVLQKIRVIDFSSKRCFRAKPAKRPGEMFILCFRGKEISKVSFSDLEALWLATNVDDLSCFRACFASRSMNEKE